MTKVSPNNTATDRQAEASRTPDSRLRAAWDDYCRDLTAYRSMPTDIPDEDEGRLDAALTRSEDALDALPAASLDGVIVKLTYWLARETNDMDISNDIIAGRPFTFDATESERWERAAVSLINDIRAMVATASAGEA